MPPDDLSRAVVDRKQRTPASIYYAVYTRPAFGSIRRISQIEQAIG